MNLKVMQSQSKQRLNGSYSWAARQRWLKEVGVIPKGCHLHHIDGNKENNNISNLRVLTPTEHQRLRFPSFELRDGVWWKKCITCGQTKPRWFFCLTCKKRFPAPDYAPCPQCGDPDNVISCVPADECTNVINGKCLCEKGGC